MFEPSRVKFILMEEFLSAQARNPAHSMRAFAKRIGVSQAAISQILSGKRSITKKTSVKILKGLGKSPEEILEIFNPEKENKQIFRSVDMDTFHLIADWYYYAILSLVETEGFQSSPKWIAERLGITQKVASEAIDRLLRLDLLKRNSKTKDLIPTGEQIEAFSEVANPALKKACWQNLDLAQAALEETQFEERDYTAITLCFDPQRMDEAKRIIKNFRRNFCKSMESKNKKEVYKLTVQLFPLTRGGKK